MSTSFDYAKLSAIRDARLSIYKLTNLQNQKVYVGKCEGKIAGRMAKHCHHVRKGTNRYLYDAIRHYGWDNFSIEIIDACSSKEELNEREIYWITVLKSRDKAFGYNMTEGGDGGGDGKALIEAAKNRIGTTMPQEQRDKISKANKGRSPHPMTEEMKDKISASLKGKMPSKPIHENIKRLGLPPNRLGKKHTAKTKQLMSLNSDHKCHMTEGQLKRQSNDWKGAGNPRWIEISKDELMSLIKTGIKADDIAAKLGITTPTVYAKINQLFGCKGLVAARKILEDEKFSIR